MARGATEVKGREGFKQEEVSLGTNGMKGHLKTQKKTNNSLRHRKPRLKIVPWSESRFTTDEKVLEVE